MVRTPAKDQVAFVGVGTTGFRRDAGGRSSASLAVEASVADIRDAGLTANDIDGIVVAAGTVAPQPHQLASMRELPTITHHARPAAVAGCPLIDAVNAIVAGT